MVDKYPHPKAYDSFGKWFKAFTESGLKKKDLAAVMDVSPQAITKYINGSIPEIERLQAISKEYGIDLQQMRDLADEIRDDKVAKSVDLTTKTAMGARVGRKWEELDDPLRTEILNFIETTLTMQRMLKRTKQKA